MKNNHLLPLLSSLIVAVALTSGVLAAPVLVEAERPGQTVLHLYYNPVDAPALPPSRVTVVTGDRLVVQSSNAPADWPVRWSKNGQLWPGATTTFLTIARVTAADAGIYTATFDVPSGTAVITQALILGVGSPMRLANLSTRATLAAGAGENVVSGFVVAGTGRDKKMIIRAVGPSLAQFGLRRALSRPVLRIFDASGRLYENDYVDPAAQGGPAYDTDLAESLAKVGAFPTLPGAADAVRLMPFAPGNYTVEVTSADHTAGTVILEIYEVP